MAGDTPEQSRAASSVEIGATLSLLRIVYRWRWLIAGVTASVIAASVLVVLLVPKVYLGRSVMMLPPEEGSGVSGLLRGLPWDGLAGGGSTLDRIITLAGSQKLRRETVKRLGLVSHYNVETYQDAVATLDGSYSFLVTREGAIRVDVQGGDPVMVAKIANTIVDIIDSLSVMYLAGYASLESEFLKTELDSAYARLALAEETVRDFAVRTGVMMLPAQLSASVTARAELEARAIDTRVGLRAGRQSLGLNHPRVRELESTLAALEHEMSDDPIDPLDDTTPRILTMRDRGELTVLMPLTEAPDLALTYGRLQRQVEIETIVLTLLVQQLKRTEIKQARKVTTIQVVDRAYPPELAIFPQKRVIVMVSAFFGLLVAVLIAFLAERWPTVRTAILDQ